MSLGSAIGQVDSGIFNDLLIAPHFANIMLQPIVVAPREGAIAYDETTKLLYYSSNYKWIPIGSGGLPPGGLPQGLIVQTTAPTGTTFVGRTIVSSTTAITVTNGNGVGGNPTLTFNPATAGITALNVSVTPAGLLPGPTVQDDVNYLGQIFNVNNGFTAYGNLVPAFVVPAASANFPLQGAASWNINGPLGTHPYGYGSDPGFSTNGTYTVQPPTSPAGALTVLFHIDLSMDYIMTGTSVNPVMLELLDQTAVPPNNIVNEREVFSSTGVPGTGGASSGSTGWGGDFLLTVGRVYTPSITTPAGVALSVEFISWSMRRDQ
jgi:hypothetical protein